MHGHTIPQTQEPLSKARDLPQEVLQLQRCVVHQPPGPASVAGKSCAIDLARPGVLHGAYHPVKSSHARGHRLQRIHRYAGLVRTMGQPLQGTHADAHPRE